MTGATFATLFGWEWRRTAVTPLFWLIQGALAASMIWAALDTAALHRGQDAAIARTLAADAAHRASVRQRFDAYRAPVTPAAPALPYWQDPSDVAGFSQYFVSPPATKPHLPLSPLAVGTSDLAPTRMDVKLATPFGIDERYDFENPRGLALGRFDLAFVLALLLPLALILQHGLLVTFERDRSMLRLVAAQATAPRVWLAARVVAITAWTVPMTLIGLVLALGVAGADLGSAVGELAAALLLVAAYMAFWTGIALLVLSRLPGAAAALGTLAAIWAILTLGVPLVASVVVSNVAPAPSTGAWIDAQRRVADAIQRDRDRITAKAVAARPDLSGMASRIDALDHATRLTFLVPETERRLSARREARAVHSRDQAAWATLIGYVSPPLGLPQTLAMLAGTDGARHRAFEVQVRAYQLGLRRSLYPLVQREAIYPTPRGASRGKYSLSDPDIIPAFAMADASSGHRSAEVLPFVAWLLAAGLILGGLGLRRADRWAL